MQRRTFLGTSASAVALSTMGPFVRRARADTIKLVGASQFSEDHPFTKAMRKFEALVKERYTEQPVEFELHLNSELGLEKDYFSYMSQGISVDYAVVSPAHMSTFSKMAPLMDMPFLFKDQDQWRQVLAQDKLKPVADDILKKADVQILGYAGGGVRNVFANQPVRNMDDLKGLSIRMQGAPIWTKVFSALGAAPTVIAYDEIYNAIQTGVIKAAENEAAGIKQMRFYEVGPDLALTQHAITVRPLCFAKKTLERLPEKLQEVIVVAGKEGGHEGAMIESSQDGQILQDLQKKGLLKINEFEGRETMIKLADPVLASYAEDLGAAKVLADIRAVC
jgi:TRAP-type C4-dicarboxylate transport system substrate-binding protein